MRDTWDQTWMNVADAIAARAKCTRAGCGAVVVSSSNRIIATGYNGPPANFKLGNAPDDCSTFCRRGKDGPTTLTMVSYEDCVSIHAEANALLFCDREAREGGTIYVTGAICYNCAKLIANSGLTKVVARWDEEYRDPARSQGFLRDCGLQVRPWG